MDELKKKCLEVINKVNNCWVEAVRKGEEEGGIDLLEVVGKSTEYAKDLDEAFIDAKERFGSKKKKKLWG